MIVLCGMIHTSPGEHGEGVQTPCTNVRVGVDENGVNVCESCAVAMEAEGFRVDRFSTVVQDFIDDELSKFKAGRVNVIMSVRPADGSEALPLGEYDVTDVKLISSGRKSFAATFVVAGSDGRRRIAIIEMPKEVNVKENGKVEIDLDARRVRGTIISEKLSDTGLMKVRLDGGQTVVRHKNRVTPLDADARAFLGPNHRDDNATH